MKIHILAIAAFVILFLTACFSPEKPAAQQQTPGAPKETADNGKLLFEEKCVVCHGADGTAGIANAADLSISKSDTVSALQTIAHGKKSMPAFAEQLSSGEIEQVTNYVFTLRK